MHPNPIFRGTPPDTGRDIALSRGFGILTLAAFGPDPVLAAHIPFVATAPDTVEAHLMRSNPVARALAAGPQRALLIVSEADAYVSPDWYGTADRVPTWNYVAVHLKGTLHLGAPDSLRAHLDRLSARFEATLAPKRPWTSAKMTPGTMERMMRTLVPVTLEIEGIESTLKLNQNRSAAERAGVIAGLGAGATPGAETGRIAARLAAVEE